MITPISILDFLHFDCPTQEQKNALLAMQDFIKEDHFADFLILCGAAGTGKTSITSALIGYMNGKDVHYKIAAPTGRAARILGRKSNTQNSTIHSLIYDVKPNAETGEVFFSLKRNEDSDATIYIIDEASMVSSIPDNSELNLFRSPHSLLSDLVRFVKGGNSKSKVIFLGDRNQLPPVHEVESMALRPEYLATEFGWKGDVHFLTEVKRQEDGSYIMKNAIAIREAIDNPRKQVDLIGFKFNSGFGAVTKYTQDYLERGADYCISIACSHRQNTFFNNQVREKLFGKNREMIEPKDLLLVTQKWSRNGAELYSGDHVTVEEIQMDKIEVAAGLHFVPIRLKSKSLAGTEQIIEDFLLLESIDNPSGQLLLADEKRLRHERNTKNKVYRESSFPCDDRYVGAIRLTYGHSITCHKAQGGEWEKVYMNEFGIPSLKYQYTAVTRAKTSLVRY
jgi:exodeoxyribonuclease-5